MKISEAIKAAKQGLPLVAGRSYHTQLPDELEPFYLYAADCGHNLLAMRAEDVDEGLNPEDRLTPMPVKLVLRGYTMVDGYPVVQGVKYDQTLGLQTEPADDEY